MSNKKKTISFNNETLRLHFGKYQNGQNSLRLTDGEGMPYMTASVSIPHINIFNNEIIIKDYSENRGIKKTLVDSKIISQSKRTITSGMVTLTIHEIL